MATVALLKDEIHKFAVELLAKHELVTDKPDVALFTLIEEIACEVGDMLAQEIIRHEAVQKTTPPGDRCPRCGRPGIDPKEVPRLVETTRGSIEIPEIEFHCERCRKSFFPSLGKAGAGGGLRLQSAAVGEVGLRRSEREQF
jgi:hypothetical protein